MTHDGGDVRDHGDRRAVRFERVLDATADEVWEALVEPERLRRWLGETTIDARREGAVDIRFGDESGGHVTGTIRAFDPPRLLEYEWRFEGEADSFVRFEVSSSAAGTTLVVDHRSLGPDAATGYAAGWHAHLDLLAEELAGGVRSDWQERFEALLPDYAAVSGR
jgi:uncharacterized protein YndB with AHSA1/START domain